MIVHLPQVDNVPQATPVTYNSPKTENPDNNKRFVRYLIGRDSVNKSNEMARDAPIPTPTRSLVKINTQILGLKQLSKPKIIVINQPPGEERKKRG